MFLFHPEQYEGKIEYKCYFNLKSRQRLDKYITQLNYRINEGEGEAIYIIGITDNGQVVGLNSQILSENIRILSYMCRKLDSQITLIIHGINQNKRFLICKIKSKNYHPNILILV